MLTTEPETSNHGEITFLEHSYSIQVQQTPLLMPELHTFIGQKRFNLGHKVSEEYWFQSKAERCWEGNTSFTSLVSKERQVTGAQKQNKCTGIEQPLWGLLPATGVTKSIWQGSTRTAVKQHFGQYCKCTFWSTHIIGGPVSLPAIYTWTQNWHWNITWSKKLWVSS